MTRPRNSFFLFVFLTALLVLNSAMSKAQQIKHISVGQGLSGRQVFSILQDRKGFMWFSTRFGIDRFDGQNIKTYALDKLYHNQIPVIKTDLLSDGNRAIWFYTNNGSFYKYDTDKDAFGCVIQTNQYTRAATFDNQNTLWIGGTILQKVEKDGKLEQVEQPFEVGDLVNSLKYYPSEGIVLTTNKQIYRQRRRDRQWESLLPPSLSGRLGIEIVCSAMDTLRNWIWIGSENNGIYRYDRNTETAEKIMHPLIHNIPIINITINGKNLLIGTDGNGYCIYDIDKKDVTASYTQSSAPGSRIAGNAIYSILMTRSEMGTNQTWLTTFSDGINLITEDDYQFKSIQLQGTSGKPFYSKGANSIVENNKGVLWIATDVGICLYRPGKDWKVLLPGKKTISLFKDSRGHIWAGTYGDGLYHFTEDGIETGHWKRNATNRGTNFVYTIAEDSKGRIWSAGKRGNVTVMNRDGQQAFFIDIYQANAIVEQNDSIMLIASEGGVDQYNIRSGQLTKCRFNPQLNSGYICDIYVESDSILWLASYGEGIERCNLKDGSVRRFTTDDGLQSDVIYALMPHGNELWYSSEKGLGRFNRKSYRINKFTRADGIASDCFIQRSCATGRDGNYYFGSYDGVVKFKPSNIVCHRGKGRIYFDSFALFNQVINSHDADTPLKEHIDNTAEVHLQYWQHSFTIAFSAIDFSSHNSGHFEWRLEGLEDSWKKNVGEQKASYTNLPSGEYTFHVKYVDDTGDVLNERLLPITIGVPFWQEPWAKAIEILLLTAVLLVIANYIRIRLNKKQAEAKVRFFIGMAHDIRTPLMLINSPLAQLKHEMPETPATRYLFELVSSNLEKLNKMLSQLLDFQKVYEKQEQLRVRPHNVNDYLSAKAEYWKNFTEGEKIALHLSLPEQTVTEWFDEEKMDDILDNLIVNAFKYTPEKGSIELALTTDDNAWHLKVSDTGIGISRKDQKKLFTRFFRATNAINTSELGTGLGLYIVKQYVMLHKGDISVRSEKGQGTCFSIDMQHGSSHFLPDELHECTLPADEKKPAADSEAHSGKAAEKDRKHYRLLVVDDNSELREYLKRALSADYQVYTAANGQEAWQLMGQAMPDVVITDLQMPVMDGIELCRTIKNNFETSHIPVIIVTVNEEKAMLKQSYGAGADDYIKKPFDIMILQSKVNNIIRSRAAIQQKYIGLNNAVQKEEESQDPNENFLTQVRQVIEKHLPEASFGVNELSDELHLSRSVLYNKFSSMTGYTPNDYIKLIRINKAILYMKEKRYSIKEIALLVGFEEASYFSTCFKKIHGISPKQFMEELFAQDREQA